MKKTFNLSLAALVLSAVIFGACSKGTTGPQGPQGPAGPDSLYSSNWIALNMSQDILGAGDTTYQQTITAPAITAGILDSGVVMMYFEYTDANENTDVEPLENYMEAVYTQGSILLISYGTNYSTEAQVRYVAIPGKVLAGTSFQGMSRTQIKSMSYKQLTQALGTQLTPSGN